MRRFELVRHLCIAYRLHTIDCGGGETACGAKEPPRAVLLARSERLASGRDGDSSRLCLPDADDAMRACPHGGMGGVMLSAACAATSTTVPKPKASPLLVHSGHRPKAVGRKLVGAAAHPERSVRL